ncbi:MAG TPA: ABC transporter substrate-binding protein [Pseudonocardiaceae bacterium]
MRIVSLLPAATDLVATLGLLPSLVGRTHECDWPAGETGDIPVVTAATLDTGRMTSREISDAVGGAAHRGSALYALDTGLLAELAPDVVLTQDLCDVCAVSYRQVSEAVGVLDGDGPLVVNLRPRNLDDVLGSVRQVADVLGVPDTGRERVAALRARLDEVRARVAGLPSPKVAAIEWLDPPWPAGHWVPDQIAAAGGTALLAPSGAHTTSTTWSEVASAGPEVVLFMPCGFPPRRTVAELGARADRPWAELPAVEAVWVLDGPAHFNRPGPRLVRGVEVLAEVLHGVGDGLDAGEAQRVAGRLG